ncbi:protein kinase [Aspergillus nomiae NRRL 13137]|uniref:Protein kinase n=1 Tax=Aspergillus nomiae NRRL (strain ATCC 15546 / NRRL 13137 / CBS 260.88 / M93) TaxID=1509407 RepID=A0A0L1JD74_ASPN3|nr:protein kinase [Aspergillus nomiae NRRL 13137]KNG89695.1 protein kinase [Aspergillus nomiae NRRL 13137]
MPGVYRAPEVTLDMEWDCKVDIWSTGTMIWDLVQDTHLFFAKREGQLNDEQHLAEIVSLMGPPPPEFLRRSKRSGQFWDEQGNWKGSIPIPEQSFEMREREFSDIYRKLFLNFLRRVFRWVPEERPSAEELAYDDFLMQRYYRTLKRQRVFIKSRSDMNGFVLYNPDSPTVQTRRTYRTCILVQKR